VSARDVGVGAPLADVEQEPPLTGARSQTTGARRTLVALVWLAAIAALTTLAYVVSARIVPGNSDGATVALEGVALKGGHLLLHGWELSLDSFWLIDAPINAIVEIFTGVHPWLLNFVPALISALVIAVGFWLARQSTRAADACALVILLGVIALPTRAFATVLLQGPLHVGTALWCLIAFALLMKPERLGGVVIAIIFLVAATVSDLQALAFGIVPVAAAAISTSLRTRSLRAALRPGLVALISALGSLAVHWLSRAAGGFTTGITNPHADGHQIAQNLSLLFSDTAGLLGARQGNFGPAGVPGYFSVFHAVVLIALIGALVFALVAMIWRTVRADDAFTESGNDAFIDDLLFFAVLGSIAMFCWLPLSNVPAYSRYLSAGVIFSAVLCARLAGRALSRFVTRRAPRLFLGAVGLGMLAVLSTSLDLSLHYDPPSRPNIALGAFLADHGLRQGIGDYWSASITTVDSSQQVVVRPVVANIYGKLVRYAKQSDDAWYRNERFNFLVISETVPYGGVNLQTARYSLGPSKTHYVIDGFLVLVYAHPFRISLSGSIGSG
jgi:hypothetical protein